MKHYTTVSVCCATLAVLSVHAQAHAQAPSAKEVTGPYIGAALGTAFGNREMTTRTAATTSTWGAAPRSTAATS